METPQFLHEADAQQRFSWAFGIFSADEMHGNTFGSSQFVLAVLLENCVRDPQ